MNREAIIYPLEIAQAIKESDIHGMAVLSLINNANSGS